MVCHCYAFRKKNTTSGVVTPDPRDDYVATEGWQSPSLPHTKTLLCTDRLGPVGFSPNFSLPLSQRVRVCVYVYVRLPVCLPFLPTIFRSVHSGPLPYTSAPRSGTLLSLVLRMGARGGPFSFPCPAAAAGPSSVAVSGGKFKLLLVNGTPRKVWGRSLGVGTVRSPSFRDYSGSRGVIFCSCYCCHSAAPDELFAPDNAQPVSSVTCCHTFLNARRNTVHFAG